MTEYIALVFCFVGIMIYLLNLAFNLSDNYDPLKMFLIGVSMFFGAILLHLGKNIAVDNGASSSIQNSMDIGFWTWTVLTTIVLMYFGVYLIIRAWNSVESNKKIRLYDEENR